MTHEEELELLDPKPLNKYAKRCCSRGETNLNRYKEMLKSIVEIEDQHDEEDEQQHQKEEEQKDDEQEEESTSTSTSTSMIIESLSVFMKSHVSFSSNIPNVLKTEMR